MKKVFRISIIILILLGLIAAGAYFYGVYYFRCWFCPNTSINGIDVSYKDISITEEVLNGFVVINDFTIVDNDGTEIFIDGNDIFEFDSNEIDLVADDIREKESPWLWPYLLFSYKNYVYTPNIKLNEDKLYDIIASSSLADKNRYNDSIRPYIEYTKENGYVLIDKSENLLDWKLCNQMIVDAVKNKETSLNLADAGVYKDLEDTPEFKKVYKEWNNIQKITDFNLTYKLASGDEVVIDSAVMSDFIVKNEFDYPEYDENDEILIDYDKVRAFVKKMSDDYDNFYKDKKFKSTRGDIVSVPYSRYTTYGNLIDVEKEYEELAAMIESGRSPGTREPLYIHKEDHGGFENNYGGTYVEVDMTKQHMYYYVDDELVLDTNVVTGCESNGNMTPECVCYIINKAQKIVLIGPGYESFVYYWMCITGQIGIHDATWRGTFGGEIYKYNGSHGCVNTPLNKMGELFDMMEIGTPVIVHL